MVCVLFINTMLAKLPVEVTAVLRLRVLSNNTLSKGLQINALLNPKKEESKRIQTVVNNPLLLTLNRVTSFHSFWGKVISPQGGIIFLV